MKLNKVWAPEACEDYVAWETQGKKTLKRINALVKDIERNGCAQGIGKPEQLRGDLSGWWSRHIDSKNRPAYRIVGIDLEIAQCQSHYGDR